MIDDNLAGILTRFKEGKLNYPAAIAMIKIELCAALNINPHTIINFIEKATE